MKFELSKDTPVNPMGSADFRKLGGAVLDTHAGRRIDVYLADLYPFLTRSGWQNRLETGEVLVNSRPVRASYKMKSGDAVHFFHPEEVEPEVDRGVRVLWQSGSVMAAYKPGNLPMHENGPYRNNTFAKLLSESVGKEWAAVHRLDRETSGIVLCGATHSVRQRLADHFEQKKIQKEYLCIVDGIPRDEQWSNCGALGDLSDSQIRIKKWVVEGGLSAETGFVREASAPGGYSLLRAFPKTGRTNQIRIHAAHSGHWIIGDKLYHPNERVFLDYWDHGKTTAFVETQTGFHRCCLHAAALTFEHPETKSITRVESPIPEDMQDLWISLLAGSQVGVRYPRIEAAKI